MSSRRLALALPALLALAFALPALSGHAAASAADGLSYDDPGMHYRAPDGWQRIDLPKVAADSDGPHPPAAEFFKDFSKGDRRAIVVQIEPYDGGLERLVSDQESELRRGDDTRINGEQRTTLANGMPAYWLCADQGSELANLVRRCEYAVFDGQRSIVVVYVGRQGYFDANEAKSALASLYVVLYPQGR